MKKLCKCVPEYYKGYFIADKCKIMSHSTIIFSNSDNLIPFSNNHVDRYFYTEKELRKIKLEKLNTLNENTM